MIVQMKKIYLLFTLLAITTLNVHATGGNVIDMLGTYQGETPGIPASFEIVASGDGFLLTHCRTLGTETCFDSEVYPTVENDLLVRPETDGNGFLSMEEMEIKVEEKSGKIWVTITTSDGMSLLFSRPQ